MSTELEIRPLGPTIGAEIRGVDCGAPIDDETVAAIRAAWVEHLVVFFPGQHLNPETQVAFARHFGDITEGHPVEPTLEGHPQVLPVDSLKDRVDFWHTDVTFMSRPPTGSLLFAVALPGVGGDTMWADTRAAYRALAEPLRSLCDDLTGIHYDPNYASLVASGQANEWDGKRLTQLWPVEHPVVRVHPETGEPNLFVNPQFTVAVKEIPGRQGTAFLRMLYEHMTDPQFIVRYRWEPGTLAFWDNRATMHYAVFDYGDQRRLMHRVTLRGERPRGRATLVGAGATAG